GLVGQVCARAPRLVDQLLDQEMRAQRALARERRLERVEPLLGFLRIAVVRQIAHQTSPGRQACWTSLACGSLRETCAAAARAARSCWESASAWAGWAVSRGGGTDKEARGGA